MHRSMLSTLMWISFICRKVLEHLLSSHKWDLQRDLRLIILATARTMLTTMTLQPNTTQATAGIVLQLRVLNFT
jgi:hypothetical protein